jgi:hypothetical protein
MGVCRVKNRVYVCTRVLVYAFAGLIWMRVIRCCVPQC